MSDILEENEVKIVLALDKAKGSAPIGYISQKSGIENPHELLQQLEQGGIVCRVPSSSWSPTNQPQYELTNKAKKLLQQLIATRLEQLIEAGV